MQPPHEALPASPDRAAPRRDGGAALLASGGKDRSVRRWDAAAGACVAAGAGHAGAVAALAFARRGGGFLVSGGADRLLKARRRPAAD